MQGSRYAQCSLVLQDVLLSADAVLSARVLNHPPILLLLLLSIRPGTPAARMKRVPTQVVKERSRQLTKLTDGFSSSCEGLVGSVQRCWVTDVASDGYKLTAHTKNYTQVGAHSCTTQCSTHTRLRVHLPGGVWFASLLQRTAPTETHTRLRQLFCC